MRLPFKNFRYDAQIFDISVGTRPDEDLVDVDAVGRDFGDGMHVIGCVRAGNLRLEFVDVDFDDTFVLRIRVGTLDDERPVGAFRDIGDRLFFSSA